MRYLDVIELWTGHEPPQKSYFGEEGIPEELSHLNPILVERILREILCENLKIKWNDISRITAYRGNVPFVVVKFENVS